MDLLSEYRSKLKTAAEAVRGNFLRGPLSVVECDPEGEHFIYNTWHCSAYDRRLCDRGRAYFTPMTFRNMDWYYRSFLRTDVAMVSVAPMDDEGNFNLSGALGSTCSVVENARTVIVEVNPAMPRIRGEAAKLPLEKVDAIVEGPAVPLWELENHAPNDLERAIRLPAYLRRRDDPARHRRRAQRDRRADRRFRSQGSGHAHGAGLRRLSCHVPRGQADQPKKEPVSRPRASSMTGWTTTRRSWACGSTMSMPSPSSRRTTI